MLEFLNRPEACVGRHLLWTMVPRCWRGTHGGLRSPLREEARFEVRAHPRHWQLSTATHIITQAHCAACFHSQAQPHTPGGSGLGSLVVTSTTGRTSCGTPERHRPSFHFPRNATACNAARPTLHDHNRGGIGGATCVVSVSSSFHLRVAVRQDGLWVEVSH